jgi:hypothetical protein
MHDATITGQVVEISADGKESGLSGVEILIKAPDGTKLNEVPALTRTRGQFSMRLAMPQKGGTIEYRKDEYVGNPEIRRIKDTATPQETVKMIKTSMTAAYYTTVLRLIASTTDGTQRATLFNTVASLPERDRAIVASAIDGFPEASTLSKEFTVAEFAVTASQKIRKLLAQRGEYENVFAWTNYPGSGNVWLGGSVKSKQQLKDLQELAAAFPTTVMNVGVTAASAPAKK